MSSETSRGSTTEAAPKGAAFLRLHWPDMVVAAVVLAITIGLFVRTFWFDSVPESLAQNVQPTLFPRLLLIVIALIALILPFEYWPKKARGIDLDAERREPVGRIVLVTAVALIVFVAVMPWLGALAALVLVAAVLPILWGERRWKILVPYVVLFPTALIWLFSEILRVTFPPGLLGNIFQ